MADDRLVELAKTGRNPAQESEYKSLLEKAGLPYFAGGDTMSSDQIRSGLGGYSGGLSGGYSGGGDYASIVQQQLKLQQQANAPAVASLQASIPEIQQKYAQTGAQLQAQQQPLEQRYQNLLSQITANQQKEEQRTSIAGSRELGRRGISSESGFYDQYQNQQLSPVTQFYTGQTATVGQNREDAIRALQNQIAQLPTQETEQERAVRNAIAQLQAGGASSAITQGLGIYQNNQQQAQAAAQLALQQKQAEVEAAAQQAQLSFQQQQNPLQLALLQAQIAHTNKLAGSGSTGSSLPSLSDIFN
jgi:hypothetical protein